MVEEVISNTNNTSNISNTVILGLDTIPIPNNILENAWYNDNEIFIIIEKIALVKLLFERDMIYILDISKSINDIYVNIELISNKYQDFKFDAVNALISNINKAVYAINENSLRDIKSTCFQFIKLYLALLDKKIHRLTIIRNNDIHICNNIEQYIFIKYFIFIFI